MSDLPQKEFQIGLAISGAVSAGAYAAGVLDFLIEALDEWEKSRTDKTVPNHRIGLKVMSGASAGAITAAIGAVSLAEEGGQLKIQDPGSYHYLPKLYESWVEKPTLVAAPGKSDFLSLTDLDVRPKAEDDFSRTSGIERSAEADSTIVTSILNAQLLDGIAKAAIAVKRVRTPPRLWVAETLHLYMTLTNLRGVPYQVPFDGGNYHMISHGDRVHYALKGFGTWSTKSKFADNDKKRELEAIWLATGNNEQKAKWKDYAICALASSAFPVGLAPRLIGATLGDSSLNEYHGRLFPIDGIVDNGEITPNFNKSILTERPFWFTCADGGIIDNDPFEYARFSLKEELDLPLVSTLEAVDRAVIMISAFPEEKPIRRQGEPRTDIVSLFSALMPALINQARFKPDELALAADESHGSRYLIGPSRVVRGKDQLYAIASGLLSGFGGFVSRSFRDHDFQLGRRNCQWFLRTCFALPEANPVIKSWSASVNRKRFEVLGGKDRQAHYYCLIPLCGTADKEVVLPAWPRITVDEFKELQDRIAQRFDRVAPLIVRQNVGGFLGFLLGLVLKPLIRNIPGLIRDRTLKFVRLTLLADLVRRDQIQSWDLSKLDTGLDADDVRLVLGELLNPRYDQRNVAGIVTAIGVAAAAGVDQTKVEAVLQKLKQARGEPFQVWEAPWKDRKGGSLYTLLSRKPGFIRAVLGGRIGLDILKPTVDPPGR